MTEPSIDWSFFSMNSYLAHATDDERVLDATAWNSFTDQLRAAGQIALESTAATPADRASAFRGLLQHLEFGLRTTMGAANPYRPVFGRAWQIQHFDWGATNPDGIYRTVNIRDDATYRISGHIGNAAFASFEFYDAMRQTGSLDSTDLCADANGNFEVVLGPDERAGNWFKVVPGTTTILSREFFGDWAAARPAVLNIACMDGRDHPWPPLTADYMTRQLHSLGTWFTTTLGFFVDVHRKYAEQGDNSFPAAPVRADSDLPYVYTGTYSLGPNEALVVEMPEFEAPYWGFHLANNSFNTSNFTDHQSSLNNTQVTVDDDGYVRLVIAHRDPGVANWIDTCGIVSGVMLLRIAPPRTPRGPRSIRDLAETTSNWMEHWQEEAPPQGFVQPRPVTRVVALEGLDKALPSTTARVTAAERRAVIDGRSAQIVAMQPG